MTQPAISSVQNPRIKQAIRLRQRRGRKQQKRLIVDGWREVRRAMQASLEIIELFVCPSLLDPAALSLATELLAPSQLRPTTVSEEVFHKLAFGSRAEGAVLVAAQPDRSLADIQLPDKALVAVLESVEKPGNLGAILRSADAAGVSAVVVADPATDLFNPNTIRASLGAVFSLPVSVATAAQVMSWLKQQQLTICAARVDGSIPYTAVDYRQGTALVLGSESEGLSLIWQDPAIIPITLPMLGTVDSLNVSATAAVLFYEAVRQRQLGDNLPKPSLSKPNHRRAR